MGFERGFVSVHLLEAGAGIGEPDTAMGYRCRPAQNRFIIFCAIVFDSDAETARCER